MKPVFAPGYPFREDPGATGIRHVQELRHERSPLYSTFSFFVPAVDNEKCSTRIQSEVKCFGRLY